MMKDRRPEPDAPAKTTREDVLNAWFEARLAARERTPVTSRSWFGDGQLSLLADDEDTAAVDAGADDPHI